MRALVISPSITKRDSKSIEKYLSEVNKREVLTATEELALFRRWRDGEEQALELIIQHNLRFVISVAKKYQHMGLSLLDLISEGNLGLIKAARRFDETKGFKFISYAVWWIRQGILQALNEKSRVIRRPSSFPGVFQKLRATALDFMQKEMREPSIEELSQLADLPIDTVRTNYKEILCSSMDAPIGDSDSLTLSERLGDSSVNPPDQQLAEKESNNKLIHYLLSKLSPKEAQILSHYYGLKGAFPMTLQDIGDSYQISRERVRQIKERAVRKLQSLHRQESLQEFLG
ncbi:MAG: RNA polymerase sigma factor RpoD/SigA [Saprospiraceae bacterium]|nr:RNA polymerase sigma factor RpoD/SigA [Saprospiraceae bacterium]